MLMGLEIDEKYKNKLRDENFKTIDINKLLALCELGENYQLFCYDLERLIKSKNNSNLVRKLYNAMEGKSTIVLKILMIKKFIEKYQDVIAIMNKYDCLYQLTVLCYDQKGNREKNLSEDYFYQYLQNHKEDIEMIKDVLLKIKNLGFDEINLNEEFDFSKKEYEVNISKGKFFCKERFSFLENMKIIPTYSNNSIKYKTNDSCYCMDLEYTDLCLGTSKSDIRSIEISNNFKNIKLKSLVFDPKRLPNEITEYSTLGAIYDLYENKMKEHENLRYSINLSMNIDDLNTCFENLTQFIRENKKTENYPELIELLSQIQNKLKQLQIFGTNLEDQTISSYEDITKELIRKEKQLHFNNKNNK